MTSPFMLPLVHHILLFSATKMSLCMFIWISSFPLCSGFEVNLKCNCYALCHCDKRFPVSISAQIWILEKSNRYTLMSLKLLIKAADKTMIVGVHFI